jgi:hypothetical protein
MLSHSPEFTYRRLLHAAKIAEGLGAQIMGLGAFTKVVGDAGVTVARRAEHPDHHRQQLLGIGCACGRLPTPCAAWGMIKVTKESKTCAGQDHGDRCHGFDRLGQRTPSGDGLR